MRRLPQRFRDGVLERIRLPLGPGAGEAAIAQSRARRLDELIVTQLLIERQPQRQGRA